MGLNIQVASSVFSFFTAFITLFLSFCLTFHVLLPTTQAFGSLENAFIKVSSQSDHTRLSLTLEMLTNALAKEVQVTLSLTFYKSLTLSYHKRCFQATWCDESPSRCWQCWWENLTSLQTSSTRRAPRSSPRSSSSSSSWSWPSSSWTSSLVSPSLTSESWRELQRCILTKDCMICNEYKKKSKCVLFLYFKPNYFSFNSDQNVNISLPNDSDDEHHLI